MANSFQDQMLKAGLVSRDKLRKNKKAKYKQEKQQPNQETEANKIKQQAKKSAAEKNQRDRELNQKKVEADNKKAIQSQIKQLIEMNKIDIGADAEVAFNFEADKKVKKIYVTETLHRKVLNGQLVIVQQEENHVLVPRPVADKIAQRDASVIILCNDSTASDSDELDDEYADYKVPDDLMW